MDDDRIVNIFGDSMETVGKQFWVGYNLRLSLESKVYIICYEKQTRNFHSAEHVFHSTASMSTLCR